MKNRRAEFVGVNGANMRNTLLKHTRQMRQAGQGRMGLELIVVVYQGEAYEHMTPICLQRVCNRDDQHILLIFG